MKNTTYIAIGVALLAIVAAYFIFRKKDESSNTTTTGSNANSTVMQALQGSGVGIINSPLRMPNETWGDWYKRRKDEQFKFNTSLL